MKKGLLSILALGAAIFSLSAQEVIRIAPSSGDMTPVIRKAIESTDAKELKIIIEEGEYFCRPEYAFEKYCAVTNHGNGLKKILFPMIGYKSIEIEGNGAKFKFHGQIMPFLFEDCDKVTLSNVTVDWDAPFTILGEVVAVNPKEGWRELKMITEGYTWKYEKGKMLFPNIDGFNYECLGSTLPFDKETKRVVAGAIDTYSNPTKIEKMPNGNFRFYEKARYYPPVGSLLSSKGDRHNDRYSPAVEVKACSNILLEGITVHHAPGMGFLFEKATDITLKNSKVVLPENTPRVIASTADATHFANCRGEVLIEGCRFENMLDDGTNVHGTYVEVHKVLDSKSVIVELKHFEQLGFVFTEPGDEMWFIQHPSPARLDQVCTVAKAKLLNERFTQIEFTTDMPALIKEGDLLENKTWNPSFTMRGCTIQNHRARNVVLKTPLKTVIEDNYFSGMMSSILFRGESFFWYESGVVEDVLIQNNTFHNVADCGTKHGVIYITPRLGKDFDQSELYDKNIRFINNTIDTSNPKLVWADRVDGFEFSGNKITINNDIVPSFPDDPTFELINSKDVVIKNNTYKGREVKFEVDETSKKSLIVKGNKGFKY
ncbi:MAG: right-handed parallel beta-helix repeat-containing protein [Rikenellaceae bacterium]